ncbi:hypothetical protein JYU05_00165, partial [bacterium AH-315-P13]|nr:hypothetical protein [bacterium AH-315-P13]
TVPYLKLCKESISHSFNESNEEEGISVYFHLSYCESLYTFCGCNKRITKRHKVEFPYINALLKEWDLYCDLLETKPKVKELPELLIKLKEMEADELFILDSNSIEVTKKGHPFVRNVCMAFDLLLKRNSPETQLFSMTI